MTKKREEVNINIWPAFSDMLTSVILMLILYLFLQEITFRLSEAYKLEQTRKHQNEFNRELKSSLGADSTIIASIFQEGTIQKISFKSAFLFNTNEAEFKNSASKDYIRAIATVIKQFVERGYLRTIVVEGHTDSQKFKNDPFGNWRLSALRAVEVVKILDGLNIQMAVPYQSQHRKPTRILSIGGFADYDFVPQEDGNEDLDESKRIQFTLEYNLDFGWTSSIPGNP